MPRTPGRTESDALASRRFDMLTTSSHGLTRKQRRDLARRLEVRDLGLTIVHPNAAGIDVGNDAHYVAVRPDRDPDPVRRFECFTADLHRLANWLESCGVKTGIGHHCGVWRMQ